MHKQRRLGVFEKNYNWQRNICGSVPEEWQMCHVKDAVKAVHAISRRLFGPSVLMKQVCVEPLFPSVDLLHLWRMVYVGRKPWLVTTSTGLPFGKNAEARTRLARNLASDNCLRILVTGELALSWQEGRARLFPRYAKPILNKIELLPPPQEVLVDRVIAKNTDEITISMIGHDFLRKGGLEATEVLSGYIKNGFNIKFQIVSNLSDLTESQRCHLESLCRDSNGRIRVLGTLPNGEVLQLLRVSHLALLLSYEETYGYSVLEAQGCGCPVITTDIGAFTETNNEECGWIIPIGKDGKTRMSARNKQTIAELKMGFHAILDRLLSDPDEIRQKGKASIDKIRTNHSPARHRDLLSNIYRNSY